jgi:hypothetical protein
MKLFYVNDNHYSVKIKNLIVLRIPCAWFKKIPFRDKMGGISVFFSLFRDFCYAAARERDYYFGRGASACVVRIKSIG